MLILTNYIDEWDFKGCRKRWVMLENNTTKIFNFETAKKLRTFCMAKPRLPTWPMLGEHQKGYEISVIKSLVIGTDSVFSSRLGLRLENLL